MQQLSLYLRLLAITTSDLLILIFPLALAICDFGYKLYVCACALMRSVGATRPRIYLENFDLYLYFFNGVIIMPVYSYIS
jgi:hypothetical protein